MQTWATSCLSCPHSAPSQCPFCPTLPRMPLAHHNWCHPLLGHPAPSSEVQTQPAAALGHPAEDQDNLLQPAVRSSGARFGSAGDANQAIGISCATLCGARLKQSHCQGWELFFLGWALFGSWLWCPKPPRGLGDGAAAATQPGITHQRCQGVAVPTQVGSHLAEFQRGQYPDSATRERLAEVTQLPHTTIRVRRCPTSCWYLSWHGPARPKHAHTSCWPQECQACQLWGDPPGTWGHPQTLALVDTSRFCAI